MTQPLVPQDVVRIPTCTTILLVLLLHASRVFAQSAPASPDGPWHSTHEQEIQSDARSVGGYRFSIDSAKTYSLAELIDLAEAHNPQTRVAWESARAQVAALGVARSELYPTLAALVVSQLNSSGILFPGTFYRQTVQAFQGILDLNYTVFDFG